MPQDHDHGQKLSIFFLDDLKNYKINVQHNGTKCIINNKKCFVTYNNASYKAATKFTQYFWGFGKSDFEMMYKESYTYFILVGGRNFGQNAIEQILSILSLADSERELIKRARIEHVFLIPFEEIEKYVQGTTPYPNDQLKILIYIDQNFEFRLNGMSDKLISGDEIKDKYLNKFELLGINTEIAESLRYKYKTNQEEFPKYFEIYRKAQNINKQEEALSEIASVFEMINEVKNKTADSRDFTHTEIEGMLIELGNYLGYDTYTVDSSQLYGQKTLKELMKLESIPKFTADRVLSSAREIDVIWFENDFPIYAFEVEHTTNFTLGLQRLYQLRYLSTNFFLVASKEREKKFLTEINKDPFFTLKERFRFLAYEDLKVLLSKIEESFKIGKDVGIIWKL